MLNSSMNIDDAVIISLVMDGVGESRMRWQPARPNPLARSRQLRQSRRLAAAAMAKVYNSSGSRGRRCCPGTQRKVARPRREDTSLRLRANAVGAREHGCGSDWGTIDHCWREADARKLVDTVPALSDYDRPLEHFAKRLNRAGIPANRSL